MKRNQAMIELLSNGDLAIGPGSPQGLMIHGYGGNKEELLGFGVQLALKLGVGLLLFDLPGHAPDQDDLLTMETAMSAVRARLEAEIAPAFVVGHSLGARLALLAGVPMLAAISPPGPALFAGNRRALIETLRSRRVRERTPYAGLQEILSATVSPAAEMWLCYASNDLKSVKDLAQKWQEHATVERIDGTSHLDIVSHSETRARLSAWLDDRLRGSR
jgi:esterase/lipase